MRLERVTVETVRPGDEVVLPRLGAHVVSAVDEYDDGVFVLSYFSHGETSFENRARDRSGRRERSGYLVEKSLAQMVKGDLVTVERGHEERARLMHQTMNRQQIERWASKSERQARAQAHAEASA